MKYAAISFTFSLIVFGYTTSFACSCAPIPLLRANETPEERWSAKRNYLLKEFKGAAFVGKVTKREPVLLNRAPYYRYTIDVTEYWRGVSSPKVIVFGEADTSFDMSVGFTSCGFRVQKGKSFFFTPVEYQRGVLEIQLCDYAGGAGELDGYKIADLRRAFGDSTRFDN